MVKVKDDLGNLCTVAVNVGPTVGIAPGTASVSPGHTVTFTPSGGSLGGVFAGGLTDQSFTVGASGSTASATQGFTLGSGFSGAAQGGYQFDRARLEGEFLWQNFGRNGSTFTTTLPGAAPSTFSLAGTRVDTYSGFLNGYYDFPTKSRLSPYLGAGLGITWVDAAVQSGPGGVVRTPGISQSAFGYLARAGLSYRMGDASALFLQYRYTGSSGFHYGGATVTVGGQTFAVPPVSGGLSNHAAELGLRWWL